MITTILSFFTGGWNIKNILVGLGAVIVLSTGLYINHLTNTIDELEIELSIAVASDKRKEATITGLSKSIADQNIAIDKMKIDMQNATKEYSEVAPKIITKYRTVVDKNSTCEQQLNAVNAIIDTFNGGKK